MNRAEFAKKLNNREFPFRMSTFGLKTAKEAEPLLPESEYYRSGTSARKRKRKFKKIKNKTGGTVIWNSDYRGTYVKCDAGEIGSGNGRK